MIEYPIVYVHVAVNATLAFRRKAVLEPDVNRLDPWTGLIEFDIRNRYHIAQLRAIVEMYLVTCNQVFYTIPQCLVYKSGIDIVEYVVARVYLEIASLYGGKGGVQLGGARVFAREVQCVRYAETVVIDKVRHHTVIGAVDIELYSIHNLPITFEINNVIVYVSGRRFACRILPGKKRDDFGQSDIAATKVAIGSRSRQRGISFFRKKARVVK